GELLTEFSHGILIGEHTWFPECFFPWDSMNPVHRNHPLCKIFTHAIAVFALERLVLQQLADPIDVELYAIEYLGWPGGCSHADVSGFRNMDKDAGPWHQIF